MGVAAPNWRKVQSRIPKKHFFLLIIPTDPHPRSHTTSWVTRCSVASFLKTVYAQASEQVCLDLNPNSIPYHLCDFG